MFRKKYNPAEISKNDTEGYSIYFDDLDSAKKSFDKFDMVSDGHKWEQAIQIYCIDNDIDVSEVDFDSESDLFAAYSKSKDDLEKITAIIDSFISSPKILISVLEEMDDEDDDGPETPEEFIEHLSYNGYNISKPREIIFFIDFKNQENARKACEACMLDGYQCLLDLCLVDEIHFAAVKKIVPSLEILNLNISYFNNIATEFDGKFDYYDDYENNDLMSTYGSEWFYYK